MMSKKQCPKCGSLSSSKVFIGSFCIDCHPFEVKLARCRLNECKKCGRMQMGKVWYKKKKGILEEICAKNLSNKRFESIKVFPDFRNGMVKVQALYRIEDSYVEKVLEAPLEVSKIHCNECTLVSGGYHEAIIQLRGNQENINIKAEELRRILRHEIIRERYLKEGTDLCILYRRSAESALRSLGFFGKSVKTGKLMGEKEGKRLYRISYCVRV